MPLIIDLIDPSGQCNADRVCSLLAHAFPRVASEYSGDWSCSVMLADSTTISHLHKTFFDDPEDTDVMSFPSGDHASAGSGYLGDVAISLTVARAQACDQGHSLTREVAYLALHGVLHLIGHDDSDDAGRQAMLTLQDRLIQEFEQLTGSAL